MGARIKMVKLVKRRGINFSVLLLASPMIVYDATQYVDGGTWNYGVCHTLDCGYSDYLHPTRYHSSTVIHPTKGSNYAEAYTGNWAQAKVYNIPPTGMSYYYNVY